METRLNPYKAAPELLQAITALTHQLEGGGLETSLAELVKIRASQLNGCAFCIHMHSRDARAAGETEKRIYLLDAWRESPLYSARERAAPAWTEAVTLVARTHVPDDVYAEARAEFWEEGLAKLTLVIGVINVWNRIATGFRAQHPVKPAKVA